jgi:hypothetical protein
MTTLRSRAFVFASGWVVGAVALVVLGGDRSYLFRVANGVDPRPLAFAELVTVIGACCVPAIAAPRLWSWERARPRALVRALAGLLAPGTIAILATAPWGLQRLEVLSLPLSPATQFSNTALFGALSILLGVWLGRRIGTIAAVVAYLGGVVVQALQVTIPLPFEGVNRSVGVAVGVIALSVAAGCLSATLGRSSRSLDP